VKLYLIAQNPESFWTFDRILPLMHKHFYEYVRDTPTHLEALIRELRESQPTRQMSSMR
jgi:hypothetical protein